MHSLNPRTVPKKKQPTPQKVVFVPRQSVGAGKFIQNRLRRRSPLFKTTALRQKLTFGGPFLDSGVVGERVYHGFGLYWGVSVLIWKGGGVKGDKSAPFELMARHQQENLDHTWLSVSFLV